MRLLTILLAFAALAVGTAGCGGGSNTAAETSTTAIETSTTQETETREATETSTETEMSTDATSTEASGFDFASGDCKKLLEAGQEFSQAVGTAASDKEKLEQTKDLYQRFVDKAPSEIRADLQVLAAAYTKIVDKIAEIDFKPGETLSADKLQELQEAFSSMNDPKVRTAAEHIATWAQTNCGS